MEQSYAQLTDNASDSYWVHSTNKSTAYFQYDCTNKELKKITKHDLAGGANFEMVTNVTGDGSIGIANFSNYDKNTKYFILRQSGSVKMVYVIANINY